MSKMAKHKYAALGFIYLFGLVCAFFIGSIGSFCAAGILAVVFLVTFKKLERIILLYIGVLAAAFLISGMYRVAFIDRCYELVDKTAVVDGRVTEKHSPDNDTVLLSISGQADGVPVEFTLFAADSGVCAGDRVKFTAVFSELRDNTYFSESSYYYSKGIFVKARAVGDIQLEKGGTSVQALITDVADWCKSRVDYEFSGETAGLIKAMLFGDKSDLSAEQTVLIRRSGIAHLTAVSGMHLSLLVHTAALILKMLFGRKTHLISVFSIVLTGILMMFFGMTASVMRSGIMMIIYYAAPFFNRKTSAYNSVSAALILILGVNPCACMDVGLWLSVLGTLGVGAVAPAVLKKYKISEKRLITTLVVSSACAALCTAPVGMLCFGGISVMAVVTGILVQPFFTLILILVPIALIIPFSVSPLLFPAGVSAEIMNKIVKFIGSLPISYYAPDRDALVFFGVALILTAAGAVFISGRKEYAKTASTVIICTAIISMSVSELLEFNNISLKIYSDGSNAIITTDSKCGKCIYTLSDSEKICDMIYNCGYDMLKFICVAESTDNNKELENAFDCYVHIPERNDMTYNVGRDYIATVTDGEIILEINGITVGFLSVKSDTKCDIAVYTGYSKNFDSYDDNYATILCDKRFYNCGKAINACYNETEIIINEEGGVALEIN